MMAQDAVPFSGGTRECSSCGCYTPAGFLIRKGSGSYYLCPNCYHPDVYPLARCIVSIPQKELEALPRRNGRLCFAGGYFLGRQEDSGQFSVEKLLPSSCTGPVLYFNAKDLALLSQEEKNGLKVLGVYRTSPRTVAVMNSLDQQNLVALPGADALYGVVCGSSASEILIRCKFCSEDVGIVLT